MGKVRSKQKVILFTCNWHAYSSLDGVGKVKAAYSTDVVPIRLSCLGRISPGIILKAFERGASGVLLLGCPEGQCSYETGNLEAVKVIEETKNLLSLLGYEEKRLEYQLLPAESSDEYLKLLNAFLDRVQNNRMRK
jgi:coenzyme F420-reducing hydrogenase delta subunit